MILKNWFPRLSASHKITAAISLAALSTAAWGQQPGSGIDALVEEVVVTATKRDESAQDVPVALTAFSERQLEVLNFRSLDNLSMTMPNVSLDNNGTSAGYQNFSIRGLGINSSIPSIDPTVGVFVDGVYQGINAGILFDNFDLEAIEVLRGPQGVLFGRNVTGGAVLLRTRKPTDELEFRGRASVETGLNYVADAALSGPILADTLSGKIAVYYRDDDGWFDNKFDGSDQGASEQVIVRPMLRYAPNDALEVLLRYEHGEADDDGPPAANHALWSRNSFDFAINERGFSNGDWDSATIEANWRVAFGDGTITNIFGWRQYENDSTSDIDATVQTQFHISTYTDQDQLSDELRYAGTFGPVKVTTGAYWFTQDLKYIERRLLALGAVTRVGGGDGTFDTLGAFAAADWAFAEHFTLNLGVRYTEEEKEVSIGTVRAGGGDYDAHTFVSDFEDSKKWTDVSPRVGLQWQPTEQTQVYTFYAKGFRSGGYNFRNTLAGAAPGPFDAEEQDSYEIGLKQQFDNGARVTVAAFSNTIDDIQREVQVPIASVGIAQLIQNVGKARIQGVEFEGQLPIGDRLLLGAQAGYTHGEYRSLNVDLNGDQVINDADYDLKLPRQVPWTYGANATVEVPLGAFGSASARLSYNHRDKGYHTDNNLGYYNEMDFVDLNVLITPSAYPWTLAVYARNLTDDETYTTDAVLADTPAFGGDGAAGPRPLPTFSTLNKGRVIGGEFRVKF